MRHSTLLLLFVAVCVAAGCSAPKGSTIQQKRSYVLKMRHDTIAELARQKPGIEARLRQAPGYGVFSDIGTHIIFVATGNGYGVVHDNGTGRDTYMRMGQGGAGLGLGIKDVRTVLVFNDSKTLRDFISSGWEFGAEADAAAKSGEKGGAAGTSGLIGMDVYQLTKAGLALEASVKGSKYWKDDELN